jgi:hypothetical protein
VIIDYSVTTPNTGGKNEGQTEDAQVRARNLWRSVVCITDGPKVLKIGAHVWARHGRMERGNTFRFVPLWFTACLAG